MMNFCPNCGTPVGGGRKFCSECGMALGGAHDGASNPQTQFQNVGFNQSNTNHTSTGQHRNTSLFNCNPGLINAYSLVGELSRKVRVEGIIWLVIGICQIVISLNLWIYFSGQLEYGIYSIILIVIGVINLNGARNSLSNAKVLEINPRGIVETYGNPSEVTFSLIYNLVIGGLIGVIGSLYEIHVRNYVKINEFRFRDAELIILEHNTQKRNRTHG